MCEKKENLPYLLRSIVGGHVSNAPLQQVVLVRGDIIMYHLKVVMGVWSPQCSVE
jgi:hypothetical protein